MRLINTWLPLNTRLNAKAAALGEIAGIMLVVALLFYWIYKNKKRKQ
jgi:hypothetical protein